MKKYKIIYVSMYILLVIIVLTKGINIGIEIKSFNDYYDKGIIDGFQGSTILLIYNSIILITIFIISLIVTLIKSNQTKYKSIIFVGLLILMLLVPTFIVHRSGGIADIIEEKYTNVLMIPIGDKDLD